VAAIRSADWVVLGPGSWFTSVMPHLLVPDLREALRLTRARRLLVLNLEVGKDETEGFSAASHLESFRTHAPELGLDVVLADPSVVDDQAALSAAAGAIGAELHVAPVAVRGAPGRHDPLRLAAALQDVFVPGRAGW